MKQSFYQIYHNSRCSKSRKALELLKLRTESYKIIRYLEIGIDENVLSSILNSKNIPKDDLIRKNEITFKNLNQSKIELNENEINKLILNKELRKNLSFNIKKLEKNQATDTIFDIARELSRDV